jgi:glycerate 2-kinase
MDHTRFMTATLARRPEGAAIAAVMAAAIATADPRQATERHLKRRHDASGDWLEVGGIRYDLARIERVLLLAVGKAAVPMAQAALDVVGERVADGLIVPKAAAESHPSHVGTVPVLPSAHPVPDERSMEAGERAIALLRDATAHDLVLVLLSGGGSALMTAPRDGLTLNDMRALTDALLASGATINEINALRRRCDRVKGGGLLRVAYPARVAVLVLSDVVGDDLQAIASGPFVPDREQVDTQAIMRRYRLGERVPRGVADALGVPTEPFDPALVGYAHHVIIANVRAAIEGARRAAQEQGWMVEVLRSDLRGEAREVGAALAHELLAVPALRPFCTLAGGETTVTLRGDGLGGRNQELALSAVEVLRGRDDLVFVSLATDGGDGPTDAAGAVVDGTTHERGRALGLDVQSFLDRNDAYQYFDALDDLLKPGPTQTNVNDLVLMFGAANR